MKYIFTHNNLEVKEVGLHSPQRATVRLRTHTAEEKNINLFEFSILLFFFFPLSS